MPGEATRTLDVSRLSVNIVMVGALLFTAMKVGGVGEGIRRDLRDLKGAVESVRGEASKAHLDAEAVLRDGVDIRSRLSGIENWQHRAERRYGYDWQFVHGRIDALPWRHLRAPIPAIDQIPLEEK